MTIKVYLSIENYKLVSFKSINDELIQNNLGNQSDIDEEARFPVEDDDDEYSSKMNERLVDTESINHSMK